MIEINVTRSLPAYGVVSLLWSISGVGENIPDVGFNFTDGLLVFEEVGCQLVA